MKDPLKYTMRPDPYISWQLLQIHLDPEMDPAGRKYPGIESTAKWVLSKASKERMDILDLGCVP